MAESKRASIFDQIRRLSAEVGGASDAQLLDRFAANRDEAAFELLLWRHAPLVFGVCLRVLHDRHDAEDAFQATFLALARHARQIARREAVAGWLHQVAYRVALTARRRRVRRETREQRTEAVEQLAAAPEPETSPENQELRCVLDQEIGRLSKHFRAAVVLCYLEGKSVDEAASLLGCPRGTVASRLARARARLRGRLARRGLGETAALSSLASLHATPRPLALIPTLTAAALRYTAGGAAAEGTLAPRITALTEEVLRAMFLHKLKTTTLLLIAFLGILLAGSGLLVGLRADAEPPSPQGEKPQAGKKEPPRDKPVPEAHSATVTQPQRGKAAPQQDYTGRLDARQSVEVRPAVSGFVQKVCFKPGAEVKKGDVLFELDARAAQLAVEKAQQEVILAEAKRKLSDADLKRITSLKAANAVSSDEVDKATERAATAEAAVRTAQVEVARARLDLESTRVMAPMSGQVSRSLVEPGTLVFRGQDRATLLTTVTSLDPICLNFDMDETSFLEYQRLLRANQVKGAGSVLRMQVAGEKSFPHEGTLESFADRVSPQSGTVSVRGTFPNPGKLLLPGMFARVRMTVGPARTGLMVPEEAILSDQGKKYVLVVNDRNLVERREVTAGPRDNGLTLIEKGLHDKDWVIVAGLTDLHPGDRVKPQKKETEQRSEPGREQGH